MDDAAAIEAQAGRFYIIDSSRVSLREYMWSTRSPLVLLIAFVLKLFRVRIPSSVDDPNVESLRPFELEEASLPPDVRERLQPMLGELAALGFGSPVFHAMRDPYHSTQSYLASLSHPSGRAVARVHHRIWGIRHPPRVHLFCEFLTGFNDGTYLWSLGSKPDMRAPPQCRVNRIVGAAPTALWQSHQQELANEPRKTPTSIFGPEAMRDFLERHHATVRDFHLGRRVFRPMSTDERARAAALEQGRRSAAAAGLEHAGVLAELDRLQNKRRSWTGALVLLIVSLGLFVSAGGSAWSWEFVALAVPVLLFHELGHFGAMRLFGYQNLRMFFIPLFGAAVSGQNYNAPGWKKAIVALMGPLPGILVGGALGIAGIVYHNDLMLKIALLALILNGINLLPVLPLDGGRVAHVLFFARHHLLDVAFRAVASFILIMGGLFTKDRLLLVLGGFMLLGLPAAYRLARIVTELRRVGFRPIAPDGRTIPVDAAQVIIGRVKAAFPKGLTNKAIAQQTLQVYETLNARPPGWPATIGFAFLHGAGFVATLVLVMTVVLGQHGDFGRLADRWRQRQRIGRVAPPRDALPKHPLDVASIATWDGARAKAGAAGAADRVTIIASFTRPADAQKAFGDLKEQAPAEVSLAQFGQSLLVAVPAADDAARARWVGELERRTRDVMVHTRETPVSISLSCVAPDADGAQAIKEEAEAYLRLPPQIHAIPPWSVDDRRTPEQQARDLLARKTYMKLETAGTDTGRAAEFTALARQIAAAYRRGDRAKISQLQEQQRRAFEAAKMKAVAQIRAGGEGEVDLAVVDAYTAASTTRPASQPASTTGPAGDPPELYNERLARLARSLGPRMGQLPLSGGEPVAGSDRYSAQFGAVTRTRTRTELRFRWLRLSDPYDGAPALARWLDAKGCRDIRYEFPATPLDLESD